MPILKINDDEMDYLVKMCATHQIHEPNHVFGRLLLRINNALKSNEKAA